MYNMTVLEIRMVSKLIYDDIDDDIDDIVTKWKN